VGAGTVSNFGGGAGTAWYLLDTSRAVKPFIFQLRRDVQLVRMDRQDDEHAFMRKKMRYGVDYRGAAAYGLWQMAYACKETLNDTNYAAARAAMMSVANAEGRPLGMSPNLLLVPPSDSDIAPAHSGTSGCQSLAPRPGARGKRICSASSVAPKWADNARAD
jgi:phage major head subunit gpT-like protein